MDTKRPKLKTSKSGWRGRHDGGNCAQHTVAPIVIHCPAKLNLFLAITGKRDDGFHDLVSVAAPVEFGDTLKVTPRASGFSLVCDRPEPAVDDSNLVLKAARAFVAETGAGVGADFELTKRIPLGAGLGGGSSDATAALVALNRLAGEPLDRDGLGRVAAGLGSDCPLFLHARPVVMRGRGEHVEPLGEKARVRVSGRRVLIFKPRFGIDTAWAYRRLAAEAPGSYLPAEAAEAKLAAWTESKAPVEALLFNNMEAPAFWKYVALPVAMERLRDGHGLSPRMSGSGSACFAFLPEGTDAAGVVRTLRELWGTDTFATETRLA